MKRDRWWYVVSPPMDFPVFGDGCGNFVYESECDVAFVEAPTKREAMRIAMKMPEMAKHLETARSNGENPFARVKVEESPSPSLMDRIEALSEHELPQADAEWRELHQAAA